MLHFKMEDQDARNLVIFLDRIEYKGLKELEDANRVMMTMDRRKNSVLEIEQSVLDRLIAFIDRVQIKGIQEIEAMMIIIQSLSHPIQGEPVDPNAIELE